MIQKMMIEIESKRPISEYGDGHVIVYNEASKNYYVQSREEFLKQLNLKMDKMFENFTKLEEKVNDKERTMDKKFEDFLKTYQETNAKMIQMIKQLTAEEDYI